MTTEMVRGVAVAQLVRWRTLHSPAQHGNPPAPRPPVNSFSVPPAPRPPCELILSATGTPTPLWTHSQCHRHPDPPVNSFWAPPAPRPSCELILSATGTPTLLWTHSQCHRHPDPPVNSFSVPPAPQPSCELILSAADSLTVFLQPVCAVAFLDICVHVKIPGTVSHTIIDWAQGNTTHTKPMLQNGMWLRKWQGNWNTTATHTIHPPKNGCSTKRASLMKKLLSSVILHVPHQRSVLRPCAQSHTDVSAAVRTLKITAHSALLGHTKILHTPVGMGSTAHTGRDG